MGEKSMIQTEADFERLRLIFNTVECAFSVRQTQKRYFKTKDREQLILAKQAEKALDKLLESLGYDLEN